MTRLRAIYTRFHAPYAKTTDQPCKKYKRKETREYILIGIQGAATIITLFMVIFTYQLANRTKEQVGLSREQMTIYRESTVIENRAYIVSKGYLAPVGLAPNDSCQFEKRFVNEGKTPAYDVTMMGAMIFNIYPEPPVLATQKLQRMTVDSGRTEGSNLDFSVYGGKGFITQAIYDSLKNETLYAFMYARITYKDVFDSSRYVQTLSRWDWNRRRFVATQKHQYYN